MTRTRIVAAITALLMLVATPAWAAEYDGGYESCPGGEEVIIRTRTTWYSQAWLWQSGSEKYYQNLQFTNDKWRTRYHYTDMNWGSWQAAGAQLSQFWTWSYCD